MKEGWFVDIGRVRGVDGLVDITIDKREWFMTWKEKRRIKGVE